MRHDSDFVRADGGVLLQGGQQRIQEAFHMGHISPHFGDDMVVSNLPDALLPVV